MASPVEGQPRRKVGPGMASPVHGAYRTARLWLRYRARQNDYRQTQDLAG